jgi:O-antigen ligase
MCYTRDSIFKSLMVFNLFILLILPQLNNVHYDPLPQFWAEVTFAWASISLFLITVFGCKQISIPRIALPLLLFALYITIQTFIIPISYPGLSYIASLEFILCIIIAISASTIIERYGLPYFISILCLALVIGAILQSIIGFIQYTGHYKAFGSLIFHDRSHPTTNVFGHFGQRNHYCHYLTWAIFGLIYLHIKNKIDNITFYSLIIWFMFSITIAASRSVFIYFILSIVISFIYYLFNRSIQSKRLLFLITISSIILIIFEYGYPLLQQSIYHNHKIASGFERLSQVNSGSGGLIGRRMVEWQKAWITFINYPILGYGLNGFAHMSVYLAYLFKNTPINSGLFTNCHNLILQLLAETGIIGTLIILIGGIWVICSMLVSHKTTQIRSVSLEIIIILCMVATTLAHSMVEYPLWYIYFLGPLVIFMSLDKPLYKLNSNSILKITAIPVTAIVYLLVCGSFIFNNLVRYIDTPANKTLFTHQAKRIETIMNHHILWSFSAMYTLDNYITINNLNTNTAFNEYTQLKYENQLGQSHPYPDTLIKQALLSWNLGYYTEARKYVTLAMQAFPNYKSSFLKSLKDKKYLELYTIVNNYK